MTDMEELIHLKPFDCLITKNSRDFYHVRMGSIRLFVAWLEEEGHSGRRIPLGLFQEGADIPSLFMGEENESGTERTWVFILQAQEDVDLVWNENLANSITQRKFIAALSALPEESGILGVTLKAYYEMEGRSFERAVVQLYEREVVRDLAFILNGDQDRTNSVVGAYDLIRGVLEEESPVEGENSLYRAVAYACRHGKIAIQDYRTVSVMCDEGITVDMIAQASCFACRKITLEPGWYRTDSGLIISNYKDDPVACVPKGIGRYRMYNGNSGEITLVTAAQAADISSQAYTISRTLPRRSLTRKDLFSFGSQSLSRMDLVLVFLMAALGTFLGILIPMLNQVIYDDYIPLGGEDQLIQICSVIASFMVGSLFLDVVRRLCEFRISSRISLDLQSAFYFRVFQLPESFFRSRESADLALRLQYISAICSKVVELTVVSGIAVICSFLYLYKMFRYSLKLSWFAILFMAIYVVVIWLIHVGIVRQEQVAEARKGESSSKLYQFLSGIEKLRIAGAEDKAVLEYLKSFSAQQSAEQKRDRIEAIDTGLSCAVATLFSMLFYFIFVKEKMDLTAGNFMAFNSAFGSFSAIMFQTIKAGLSVYSLHPLFQRFRPFMDTSPEDDGSGGIVTELEGKIEVSDLSFSYDGHMPVLSGISYIFERGKYIGIAGASGCGKTSLIKLLLGFETPNRGYIRYDGRDLSSLDKQSLRKKIGVVLQNGKLIAGSIYENITITAPEATMADVQRVIEAVGLKEDIDRMPMGIYTILSEDAGTISGGQMQRILIARAIINNPAVLIFDEATSALDNITQAEICANLEKMKITRIAVAHRLSTIRNCDEILVLDGGKIAEIGNYETLMARRGLFFQLASRQIS